MRVIAEIPHPECHISIFYMNQKYLIKIEKGHLEQTFKVSELDYIITGVEDIKKMVSPEFINSALTIFNQMKINLSEALKDFE